MQNIMYSLKSYQEVAKHVAKTYILTVNHEQSLFNCLTILFSSIFIHIFGVLQISFILYEYVRDRDKKLRPCSIVEAEPLQRKTKENWN